MSNLNSDSTIESEFKLGTIHKRCPQEGGEGAKGKRTHADMGDNVGGSSKGGRPLLVRNQSTELFGGEKIL